MSLNVERRSARFTLVFEGDIGATRANPFETDTPYGRPCSAGRGDAIDAEMNLREWLEEAIELLEIDYEASIPGSDTYAFLTSTKEALRVMDDRLLAPKGIERVEG